MKATFKRWVIGKVIPGGDGTHLFVGDSDELVDNLVECELYETEDDAKEASFFNSGEVVLEATVTVEVNV